MITRKTTTPMLRTIVFGVLIGALALVIGPSAIAQSVSSAGVVGGPGYNSVDIDVGLVVLTKHQPREASLGQQYEVMLEVKVVEKVADITVTDAVPKGASFVRSEPQGKRDGKNLTWRFKNLDRGDSRVIKIYLRPERQGDLSSCATVTVIPQCCVTTFVGKAEVDIAKSGPTQVKLDENIDYAVTVTNTGSAIARDVVVIDTIPNGLTHASGKRPLTFDVGTLEPQ